MEHMKKLDEKVIYALELLIDISLINQVRANTELPKLTPEQYKKVLSEVKKHPDYEKSMKTLIF